MPITRRSALLSGLALPLGLLDGPSARYPEIVSTR
jgi:hypothetical protein